MDVGDINGTAYTGHMLLCGETVDDGLKVIALGEMDQSTLHVNDNLAHLQHNSVSCTCSHPKPVPSIRPRAPPGQMV